MTKIVETKIDELIPDSKNANKGTEYGQSLVEKSLRKFGAGRSILIDKNNKIIAGNKTVENAANIGLDDVIIVESDGSKIIAVKRNDIDLDSEEGRELAIADNATAKENIDWDVDVMNEISKEWNIKPGDWGIDFGEMEIFNSENEDIIPEVKESFIKSKDIIEMNNHRLFCGDSTNNSDIEFLLNGIKADMIFTDPPYDLEDNYTEIIINAAKDDCHIFIMDNDKSTVKRASKFGCFRKIFVVDIRTARLISNNQPMQRTNLIAEFLKGKGKFNNLKDGFTTLIESNVDHKNYEDTSFNQAKKVELPETFILHYSKKGEIICDFFGGVGSTLIAAEKNNRVCYMNEIDPVNCDIIIKRWILHMIEYNRTFEIKINGKKLNDIEIKNITK